MTPAARKRKDPDASAVRVAVRGEVQGVGFRDATVRRAGELGVLGWVRNGERGEVLVHAEGREPAVGELVAFLREGPPAAAVAAVEVEPLKVEGHEQFAVRGVSAGVFVVQEHAATAHHFDLRLEVDGAMRSWAVPKGPSLDPAVKRLALEVGDHDVSHNDFEGPLGEGRVIVWDRGSYENLRDEPMEEALDAGHASFRLDGEKLHGGWSLRHIDGRRWLLVKRRDEHVDPDRDPVRDEPESVLSGLTIEQVQDHE